MSTTSENLITLNEQGTLSYGAAVHLRSSFVNTDKETSISVAPLLFMLFLFGWKNT